MTEAEFALNMRRADVLRIGTTTSADSFWVGYVRGLRRHYHGGKFGTPEEHEIWMKLANNSDEVQRHNGIGYQAGFRGLPAMEAMKTLNPNPVESEVP